MLLYIDGCTRQGQCFSNCACAVLNLGLGDTYVLCFVKLPSDDRHGHALFKVNGNYYDPTLGPQGITNGTYWLHSEYSKKNLVELVIKNNADKHVNGTVSGYPPALRNDGKVVYEEINT